MERYKEISNSAITTEIRKVWRDRRDMLIRKKRGTGQCLQYQNPWVSNQYVYTFTGTEDFPKYTQALSMGLGYEAEDRELHLLSHRFTFCAVCIFTVHTG